MQLQQNCDVRPHPNFFSPGICTVKGCYKAFIFLDHSCKVAAVEGLVVPAFQCDRGRCLIEVYPVQGNLVEVAGGEVVLADLDVQPAPGGVL
jgi:hypothetical protein